MIIRLHKQATTTPKIRAEIQASKEAVSVLAKRYAISEDTVYKWRKRTSIEDRSHTPHRLQTVLTPAQELVVVELRKMLLIPLDDLLSVTKEFINPNVSRSGLDRCLRRHHVGNLSALRPKKKQSPHAAFKDYEPGYIHVDIKYLPKMADEKKRRYLFVAIDRATRWVFIAIYSNKTAKNARDFLQKLSERCPLKIKTLLTDNGREFTDKVFGLSAQSASGSHEFDLLCAALEIDHRLTKPRRPQTNGMVERFNGRIEDVLQSHHFHSKDALEKTLHRYVYLYNTELPQSVLGSQSPLQKMKAWYNSKPELFKFDPSDLTGCDSYRYSVVIKPDADSYKMKLVHQDFDEHIEAGVQHLSYGEKNAFALVLFMHQVLSEMPDLTILDDPVSSFDKTKKFAILNKLFRGKESLRGKTVLMLTHDIEPAIDVIHSVKGLFQHPKPTAYFLASSAGKVSEVGIQAQHIQTFAQICATNVRDLTDQVIKCIYLRRHFEIINNCGDEYNYLANLLHARDVPTVKNMTDEDVNMSEEEIESAESGIKEMIPDFNYATILEIINNKTELKQRFLSATVGYDKLQLFRIYRKKYLSHNGDDNNVLRKFVNESFHIENEYVMQLNPREFDNIPEYIIQECDRIIGEV